MPTPGKLRAGVVVAALVLLAGGGVAQAKPPTRGLCANRTGDALTRCLYSELDNRLRALGSTPTKRKPPKPSPTTTPPSEPPASGDWLSGAAGPEAASGAFGTWRGSKVEIGQTWINSTEMYTIAPGSEWGSFTGPMLISLTPPDWNGWAGEADGAHDAYWTAIGKKAASLRAGRGTTYLNPYIEFNGDWAMSSVTRTTQGMADFRAGYERTSAILRREFPGVKLVINPAAGRDVPAEMWPASSSFDLVGINLYNEWPHCATASCVPTFLSRITPLADAAKAKGKPIGFPEWGISSVASSPGGGGEAPAVVDGFHKYFADNAGTGPGQVVFETYFNIGGYPGRYELFTDGHTNPLMPQTVEQYRDDF